MTSRARTIVFLVAGLALAATVLGLGAAYRDRLGWLPIAGRWLAPPAQAMWVCPMDPEVRQPGPGTCPKCGMDLVPEEAGTTASGHEHETPASTPPAAEETGTPRATVELELRRQQLIGVRTAEVASAPISRSVRAVGVVKYDETRQHDVNVKVEGWIRDLYVDFTGQPVRKGQPLFTLYSPDLLATQNEHLLALRTLDQMQQSKVVEAREYAGRMLDATRQRLTLWDLPKEQIDELERTRQAKPEMLFRSPATGFVVEKRAVKGMRVMPGEMLYRLADLSRVWIEADLYESEMSYMRVGARADVTLDAYPGERFPARIAYVYPYVEEATRTVRVRFELPNGKGRFKPGMYANVDMQAALGQGLTVPTDAVIDTGSGQYVFVAQGDGFFEPRRVKAGARFDGRIQVTDGLEAGERVASGATFFLDSESQLRAAMQGYADAPAGDTAAAGVQGPAYQVAFATEPDPPRNGDNAFVVSLRDPDGRPVTDADVTVRLYMAPMPSMNMPAMRSDARILHVGGGIYRGQGHVSMGGRWDVTVVATRGGTRVAAKSFAIVAK
jgi:RND family efflux transporter MFP subunit